MNAIPGLEYFPFRQDCHRPSFGHKAQNACQPIQVSDNTLNVQRRSKISGCHLLKRCYAERVEMLSFADGWPEYEEPVRFVTFQGGQRKCLFKIV